MKTLESFERLIATHGSDLDRWPEGERQSAQQLLTHSAEAKALFAEQQAVDALLDAIPVPSMTVMEKRIMRNLATASRSSLLDRVLDWIMPRGGYMPTLAWRPALLACLPLICGIYMADFYSFGIDTTENSWQEELYLISMNDYAEIPE
ncbi:MAG: hypothetical protein ACSHXZ_01205 [Gammaproteobacteria bacterium]